MTTLILQPPSGPCMAAECTRTGSAVILGVVLCRVHRSEARRRLNEMNRAEHAQRAEKKQRDAEAHQVALQAAGERPYRLDRGKGSVRSITSGGLPTLGKDR